MDSAAAPDQAAFGSRSRSGQVISTVDDLRAAISLQHQNRRACDTLLSDEARFFSGEGAYDKTVTIPESFFKAGREIALNFGEGTPVPPGDGRKPGMRAWLESPVREAALVYAKPYPLCKDQESEVFAGPGSMGERFQRKQTARESWLALELS